MQDEDNRITTLEPREQPTAAQIIEELRESIVAASGMGVFDRLLTCNNTRRCQWSGKVGDGRLPTPTDNPNTMVFRWPGAPDVGVPLVDTIVRWLVMKRVSVHNRGDLRIAPRRLPQDGAAQGTPPPELAAVWQGTLDYFSAVQDWNLSKNFELFSTCVEDFGYGAVLADWVKRTREEKVQITLQEIGQKLVDLRLAFMQEAAAADGLEITPEMVAQATSEMQVELESMLAGDEADLAQVGILQGLDPRMSDKEARAVIKQLRADSTKPACYYAPRDDGGMWELEALIPWVSCLHPHDLTGEGKAEWFAVPRYWSEAKIRERAQAEDWNKAATNELLANQRNQFFTELFSGSSAPAWALNGTGIGLVPDMQAMDKMPRWLVVYVWRKITTKAGRPMVYKGIVNPHMADQLILWEPTDLEDLPWLVDTSEPVPYAMLSRGVADVHRDKQQFVKDRLDEEGARGQLGSNPPLNRTVDQNVKLRPGIQLYTKRSGTSFLGSEFMKVPEVDQGSLKLMEIVRLLVNEYYFRGETVDPEDKRLFHEWQTFKSIRVLKELHRLLWKLTQEHISVLQASNINGRDVSLAVTRDQLRGEADITIGVHLDGYSEDAAEKFMKVYQMMVQNNQAGNIDEAEGMNIMAQLLTPTFARRLILPADVAANRIEDDQDSRIAKIMAGVPVKYQNYLPGPQLRDKRFKEWMAIPGNVQRAMSDPSVAAMMQKEQEYIQVRNTQQNENPATGRAGVKPNTPEELAAA